MPRIVKTGKILVRILVGIILISILLFLSLIVWSFADDFFDKRQGDRIAVKLEQFHTVHGCYPEKLAEIGVEEKDIGPCYQLDKKSDSYDLWFGRGLGESFLYNSKEKVWGHKG